MRKCSSISAPSGSSTDSCTNVSIDVIFWRCWFFKFMFLRLGFSQVLGSYSSLSLPLQSISKLYRFFFHSSWIFWSDILVINRYQTRKCFELLVNEFGPNGRVLFSVSFSIVEKRIRERGRRSVTIENWTRLSDFSLFITIFPPFSGVAALKRQ